MAGKVKQKHFTVWYTHLKKKAKRLKRQVWSLFLAWKDPSTPILARIVVALTVAYAVSPIDLIPDFIPVLGLLDDIIILPALIALALHLIPRDVVLRCRREAWKHLESGDRVKTPAGTVASAIFIVLWVCLFALIIRRFI